MKDSDYYINKRRRFNHLLTSSSILPRKKQKQRSEVVDTAFVYIKPLQVPLVSTSNASSSSSSESISLQPFLPYTIGRNRRRCEFVFEDRRVSNRHCQVLFDALNRRIYISDGLFLSDDSNECSRVRVSLNGVFVNGVRIGRGQVSELCAGDQVLLVCGNGGHCSSGIRIGFVIERIVFVEEVVCRNMSTYHSKRKYECSELIARLNLLSSRCKEILCSDDPISYIRGFAHLCHKVENSNANKSFPSSGVLRLKCDGTVLRKELPPPRENVVSEQNLENKMAGQSSSVSCHRETIAGAEEISAQVYETVCRNVYVHMEDVGDCLLNCNANGNQENVSFASIEKENALKFDGVVQEKKIRSNYFPPPGNKFYLNRLRYMGHGGPDSPHHRTGITLPDLLYPVESLTRIFIATFTSDILWFLSYCEVPHHLPVTIACHNTERCWRSSPDQRMSVPYSDFPNLVVVNPPFPETIAFGKDRKKLGIACHHPKLIVLPREDTIRVIITSANLVSKQWNNVTNTVWWQDFPRRSAPDYLSLFSPISDGEIDQDLKSDFAAQLAGFMASLVIDVPSQAYWVLELAKYDFTGATGHLVASVPGIHSPRAPSISKSTWFSPDNLTESRSFGANFIGSVEASVVGLSHVFRISVDSNGAQLKKLAFFLGKCRENAFGMSQIVLRRNKNIPVDINAVSVLVPDPDKFCEGDCVQLGFLPRDVAKWVAPLWDIGLFRFLGYIYPKDVLGTALDGNNNKVQLILYVVQGPNFSIISEIMQPEHVTAICSLVALIQRCVGLWRLHEVLGQHKWPENLETDFIFGSSSIGSINAQFLAAFSAAAGKRSLQFSESEESDPDWGCWSASQESRNPSIRIIFPTIDRVKNASSGIWASKHLLCFSQKTWQRLRNINILHDAIPHSRDRVGHPMHIKVGRRRFQSKTDAFSFGWVYSGSHNFSAAAWGRPISNSLGIKLNGAVKINSVLGSRLHICNYELGIIFIVPPSDARNSKEERENNLDDIILPFVTPAPKYKTTDMPATKQAMREALAELSAVERESSLEAEAAEVMEEEIPDEEEEVLLDTGDYVTEEKEDEKAYAEVLWSQVDSSESC